MNNRALGLWAVVTPPGFGSRFPLYLHSPRRRGYAPSLPGAAAIGQPFTGSITDGLAIHTSVEVAF